ISWKLLADRVAVTWADVPEYFQENSNTFQAEMYFDGRIQISYLNLDSDDGLVGLSAGTGIVPGFVETDLSALGSCGALPPAAGDSDIVTDVNTPVQIALVALDDGLPNPPGALTYTILTLPTNGTLVDPGLGPIDSVPHALAGSSGLVDYVPDVWTGGGDGFQFDVNDGGVPPTGGDSNTATVSITIGNPQTIFSFNMDVDPGWTTEGQWEYGRPLGGGSHDGDPTSGFTGAKVYGYNLAGDYPNDLPPTHLTTTVLDCSNLLHAEVQFQRWLGVAWVNFDHATLSASNDGNTWVIVWDHDGGAISDTEWLAQSFDISGVADGEPTVFLRWTMGPTDDFVTYPGWNIDDVEIRGVIVHSCAGAVIGDVNLDGLPDGLDIGPWIDVVMDPGAATLAQSCGADANVDGGIDMADLPGFVAALLSGGL
ncbi:MAG: hypothetical protein O7D94_11920, partial [Planctomycetota bacterium]|nr:hypothetical protein [Planctomycetota bacterium]